jgi:hypothetical protein
MKRNDKIGLCVGLIPIGWHMLGLPETPIVGAVCWAICILIWKDEIAAHARTVAIAIVTVLCVIPVSYVLWLVFTHPLTEDARKAPVLPPSSDPPKAPPVERIPRSPNQNPPNVVVKTPPHTQTPPPPTTIEIAPAYGNLRDRCFEMAAEIGRGLQFRNMIRPKAEDGKPVTAQQMHDWELGNDHFYRFCCEQDVMKLDDELAELHIRDPELDQILARDKEHENFRRMPQDTDVTGVFCTSGSEREFTLEGSWYAD